MARFTVNSTRFDPYLGYRFKLKWDGQYVAAVNKCGGLKRTTEVTAWYEGGDASGPHQIPGNPSTTPSHWKPASPTTPRSKTGRTR